MCGLTSWYLDGSQRNFKIGDIFKTKIALPPGAEMVFGTASVTDIEPGLDGYIFVYGKITYTDEFNTVGWTEFCHRYPYKMMDDDGRIRRKYGRYHELGGNNAN